MNSLLLLSYPQKKNFPLKMATDDDGRSVLKIIFPGGKTVLYYRPVPVKEIMDENPNYCITRPDFFRVPWFVVSPKATLVPGKQYLIVPKHTVKHILKENKTKKNTASSGAAPASKESPNSTLKRSATIHPDQGNVNHGFVPDKGSSGAKLGCVPLASQSMAKFKVSSRLFLSSFTKVNKIKELHVPYFRFTQTQKAHPAPPPQPPQIHLPEQAPQAESHMSANTKKKVSFRLPTTEDIVYYTPVHDSSERDADFALPCC
ncbi:hypothetical protein SUGI_0094900 [Cryptomeria japonica]|nr:hypothetical protein SUGI_0094900 [Cryptomeria japonica]